MAIIATGEGGAGCFFVLLDIPDKSLPDKNSTRTHRTNRLENTGKVSDRRTLSEAVFFIR